MADNNIADRLIQVLDWDNKKGGKTEVLIRITSLCNLRCGFCFVRDDFGIPPKDLILDLLTDRLKSVAEKSDISLNITGGEPLVRNDFFEILSDLVRLFKVKSVNLQTNAVLINRRNVMNLVKNNVGSAFVGLPALNEEDYYRLTGKRDGFSSAIRGIHTLLDAGIKVCLNIILTRLSLRDFDIIPGFVLKEFGKSVSVNLSTLSPGTPEEFLKNYGVAYPEAGVIFQKNFFELKKVGIKYGSFGGDCCPPICAFGDRRIHKIFCFGEAPLAVIYIRDFRSVNPGFRYKSVDCKKCRYDSVCTGVSFVYAKVYKRRNFHPI